jgi:hypothetical protein
MSGTNQILIDADVNPLSENIHAIQKVITDTILFS